MNIKRPYAMASVSLTHTRTHTYTHTHTRADGCLSAALAATLMLYEHGAKLATETRVVFRDTSSEAVKIAPISSPWIKKERTDQLIVAARTEPRSSPQAMKRTVKFPTVAPGDRVTLLSHLRQRRVRSRPSYKHAG